MNIERKDVRNIAIIAHVDHGKTTLVDQMLRQGGTFRENQQLVERVMDSNDLERERGITILSKNTSIRYEDVKINIIDTPGHADFGGEVERVLKMVDGVLLLIDAFEGPMPQTRFVLQKALALKHRVLLVVNKIDRADARPNEVIDEVLGLLIDLDADESQLDSPILFTSARNGTASETADVPGTDMKPLFDAIVEHIPAPQGEPDEPLQMLVSTIDYSEYVGRIGIGRISRGKIALGQQVVRTTFGMETNAAIDKIGVLYAFEGLRRQEIEQAQVGDIIAVSGMENISIGDTICDALTPEPLPFVQISEPTVAMTFSVNDSPFAGREGKFVTSRHLRARLYKEIQTDVSLRVEDTESTDAFLVSGRGELHLSIFIETMRRQGYEFQVSKPEVLYRTIDGEKCEPIERVVIDCPQEAVGAVMEGLGRRKGTLEAMNPVGSRTRLEFLCPARGLFGYAGEFMTVTRGEGIFSSVFERYEPYRGDIPTRMTGSLVAFETGEAVQYGLFSAQERGRLFVVAGTQVYAGMLVGSNARLGDIEVNVCRKKQLTNMRAAGSDDSLRLDPVQPMTLEEALEFIDNDELVEITPQSIRLRKRILDATQRKRANR